MGPRDNKRKTQKASGGGGRPATNEGSTEKSSTAPGGTKKRKSATRHLADRLRTVRASNLTNGRTEGAHGGKRRGTSFRRGGKKKKGDRTPDYARFKERGSGGGFKGRSGAHANLGRASDWDAPWGGTNAKPEGPTYDSPNWERSQGGKSEVGRQRGRGGSKKGEPA